MPSGATAPPAARASSRSTRFVKRMASRTRNSAIGCSRQLADETTPENHDGGKILTFIRRFADNARDYAFAVTKTSGTKPEEPDGIYHKKRQPREAAQRLRRRRRLRQPQAFAVGRAHRPRVERIYQRNHPPRRHGGKARRHAAAAQRPRDARRSGTADRAGQGARLPRQGVPPGDPQRGQAAERDGLLRGSALSHRGKGQAPRGRVARRARGASWRWTPSTASSR